MILQPATVYENHRHYILKDGVIVDENATFTYTGNAGYNSSTPCITTGNASASNSSIYLSYQMPCKYLYIDWMFPKGQNNSRIMYCYVNGSTSVTYWAKVDGSTVPTVYSNTWTNGVKKMFRLNGTYTIGTTYSFRFVPNYNIWNTYNIFVSDYTNDFLSYGAQR